MNSKYIDMPNTVLNISALLSLTAEISRWAASLLQTHSCRTVQKMHTTSPQDILEAMGYALKLEVADTHM